MESGHIMINKEKKRFFFSGYIVYWRLVTCSIGFYGLNPPRYSTFVAVGFYGLKPPKDFDFKLLSLCVHCRVFLNNAWWFTKYVHFTKRFSSVILKSSPKLWGQVRVSIEPMLITILIIIIKKKSYHNKKNPHGPPQRQHILI